MVIHMPPNFTYEFIADDLDGHICFTVLEGSLTISLIEDDQVNVYNLKPNESIYTPRSVFRRTSTQDQSCTI